MAIASTASRWQPAPPTDGKQQNQGIPEEILIPLWFSVVRLPGSTGSGRGAGFCPIRAHCAQWLWTSIRLRRKCSAKAFHRGFNSATPAAASSARRTERGRSVTLCAPGVVSEKTSEIRSEKSSPAENSRSPDACPASASLSLAFPLARSSSGVGVTIRSDPRRCSMGSSSQNLLNSSRYFFQLSFASSDLLSKSGKSSLFCLVMPMAKPSRCFLLSKMRFTGNRNL